MSVRKLFPEDVRLLDLDLLDAESEEKQLQLAHIRGSLAEVGFLILKTHGISLDLVDRCYQLSREFFALPDRDKNQLDFKAINQKTYSDVGYYPLGKEIAVGSNHPDLKEFFHIGIELAPDHELSAHIASNVWPDRISGFREEFLALFESFSKCGDRVIAALAEAYDLNAEYFADLVEDGNHMFRSIHYPPVNADEIGVRAAQHTGIQLLGLQPRTTHPGLQYCTPNGEWVELDAESFRDCILVNIGDMLEYVLDGLATASLHRVTNAVGVADQEHRFSMVFFYHANPLKKLLKRGRDVPIEKRVVAGTWLLERLREIGLIHD